jgi:hypothetical protein
MAFDSEAQRFAAEIDGALRESGWNVRQVLNQTLLRHEIAGVVVRTPSRSLSSGLQELVRSLREEGFEAGAVIGTPDDEDWVVVADNATARPSAA